MKTTRLLVLLCIIVTTLNAQESENLYESGDIKMGIAAMPLLDLGNGCFRAISAGYRTRKWFGCRSAIMDFYHLGDYMQLIVVNLVFI